jgi:anti-anti-sigma factor
MSSSRRALRVLPTLEVALTDQGTTRTVAPSGEIDLATVAAVEDSLSAALSDGLETVVLDLGAVTFVDSTAINMILRAHARAKAQAKRFVVLPGPIEVQRVFELCSLLEVLPFAADHSRNGRH